MIAISYRREDSTPVAGRLHDRLQAEFGKKNVFMDFDSIPFGVDFREHIRQTLERAQVVIAVIGPMWLGGRGKGHRRINDPSDFVRLEIATALQREIPVIPVLVGDTLMPATKDLPADLQGLAFRNALVLDTGVDFHHHADRLIAGIRELVKQPAGQSSDPNGVGVGEPTRAKQKEAGGGSSKKILLAAAAVLVLGIFGTIVWFVSRQQASSEQETVSTTVSSSPAPSITETPPAVPAATLASTPVSAPAPSVVYTALPSPPLTPASAYPTMITDDEIRSFINEHYRATERRDFATLLSHYPNSIDFLDYGYRDRSFIQDDLMKYFQRWPVTTFTIGDIQVVHSPLQPVVTAYFDIRYNVRDPASGRSKQGRANEVWTISKSDGALRISSQKENVREDPLPPLRRKRR